jgi:thiol-disulfide isomerase/thioredoxin
MKFSFFLGVCLVISHLTFSQQVTLHFQLDGRLKNNEFYLINLGGKNFQATDLSTKTIESEINEIAQISFLKLNNKGKILGEKGFWLVPGSYTITGTSEPFTLTIDPINEYQQLQDQLTNATSLASKIQLIEANLDNIVALANLNVLSEQLEKETIETLLEKIPASMHLSQSYLQLESDLRKREYSIASKGTMFTNFELESKTGEIFTLENFKGKPTLVEFTFTGCAGCVKVLPELKEIYDQYHHQLNMVSIYSDKRKSDFENNNPVYKKELVTWTSLWDPTNFVSDVNKVTIYPTFIILDSDGVVIDRFTGGLSGKVKRKITQLNLTP